MILLGTAATSATAVPSEGVACPLQWLPVFLAGTPVPPTHRRLLGHTFTTKDALEAAVQAYNADVASAEAMYGPIANWDVSGISDMSKLFYIPDITPNFNADISSWDTSGVTDMSYMFYGASAFNQLLSFDTSSVTDMSGMFWYALAFNQPLSFDTYRVTDMAGMFGFATAFNQPLRFVTSRVTEMGYMFEGATNFNQPLSFDTSRVTNMITMFLRASAFNQPLSFDTSRVTSMTVMFKAASSLSAANKLLIRCAWAGTDAFASAGYDENWAPGSC